VSNECYDNVRRHVTVYGGSLQHGWLFCGRWHDDLVIAHGHAVWRDAAGELVDITPRLLMPTSMPRDIVPPVADAEGHLLFLPTDDSDLPKRALPLTRNKTVLRHCRRLNRVWWAEYQDVAAESARVDRMVDRMRRRLEKL
jgi:hypothetical protein